MELLLPRHLHADPQDGPHVAIPLSRITTFGVACCPLIDIFMRYQTIRHRLIIDYPIAPTVGLLPIYSTMARIGFNIDSPS